MSRRCPGRGRVDRVRERPAARVVPAAPAEEAERLRTAVRRGVRAKVTPTERISRPQTRTQGIVYGLRTR